MELEKVDPSVEFLYKTMLQRDPKKRKVKPVQRHLIQTDFGGVDDSDDSDFQIEGNEDSDAGDTDKDNDDDQDNESNEDDDDDDDSDDDDDDDDEESRNNKLDVDNEDIREKASNVLQHSPQENRHIKVTICCVCLGDVSEEDDEIVECDNCGASVHEGCYGISENQSNASTESSASTEPWFCDACKAGCKPMPRRYKCTLCKREPNQRERRNVTADQRTLLERRFGVRPANDSVLCNRCRYKCYLILKKKEKKVASETEAPALPLNNDASLIELPLPSAPRGHASCCICRKASQKLIVMSAAMRHQAFIDRGIMITAGSRCCPVHVNDDILSDYALGLLKASSDISVIKGDALIELLQYLRTTALRHEKTRLNFDDERSLSDEEYLSLLGVGKAAFKDMLTYLDGLVRNTPARSTKTSLAIFLLKMRSGMSNKMLSTVFNVSKSSIRRCISNVSNVLKEKFVSESLGFQSISRSDVINNHTRKLAQTLFCDDGKSQAVLVLDGTYIYIQKSGHFRFQRQSFSIHKGRPLVKPMIIVSTDGHFISVLGPYLAKDNDASILKNALLRNVDEMREWLDEEDIFIVDRGFRDALPYLKELGIQAEMPTFLRKGETQMSTEDANSSRLVTKMCELCPNTGGIFKETDAGKWVHLVCALYTPGVAFGDVDKLSPVTLFEMPYSKWGARECSLCEDARFSNTGVCISCDAGMCRTYFHVTCAQREGLLSEAAPEECMDIADPFFAYCKMHAEKMMARAKRRNWLAIQSYIKNHPQNRIEDEKEKARFDRKLNRHRQKYQLAYSRKPPAWVPTQKLVRHLTSSPSAMKKMLRKAELMGIITQSHHISHEKQEVRKKSATAAAFSVEFVNHYLERNSKIETLKTCMKDIVSQNSKLQEQEKILRRTYDQLLVDVEKLRQSNNKLRKDGEYVWKILNSCGGKLFTLPEILKVKKSQTKTFTRQNSTTLAQCSSPPSVIHQCALCKKTSDQHLLTHCDNCKMYYHLGCLDPPLTRMPKKNKMMGWQCSECDKSSDDETPEKKNLDAPRKLREKIKEPTKWSPDMKFKFEFEKLTKHSMKGTRRGRKKKRKIPSTDILDVTPKPKKAKSIIQRPPRRSKVKVDEISEGTCCVSCNRKGDSSNMVKCDECKLCYHFGCLDPPMKKTPKQRGYSWHCEACDPSDSDSDDDDDEDDDPEDRDDHEEDEEEDEDDDEVQLQYLHQSNEDDVVILE